MKPKKFKTEIETINNLNLLGYNSSFVFENGKLRCSENGKTYSTEEVKIDGQFRFEGMTNPSDSSILFAISCSDNTKGTIISAYGLYADVSLLDFMDNLEMRKFDK